MFRLEASAIAFNQGEVCTAGSRLLVESSVKERFLPMVVEALKEVDLTIETGQFTGVAGASGSGRTTLLNMVDCIGT